MTIRAAEGNYPPHSRENHERGFMWMLQTLTCVALFEKRVSTCHCLGSTSVHFTSYPVTLFCITSCDISSLYNKLQQFASASTFNHYHSSILWSLYHFETSLMFSFFPFHTHSYHKYFQLPYQLSLDPQGFWLWVKCVDECQQDETENGHVRYSECGLTTINCIL